MKLETKANWAIGLSITSIALTIVMFAMWCCNAGGFSAVSLDTFVGVIVALLAIIVTIAIGWQIWAAMDLKSNFTLLNRRIHEIETLKTKIKDQENNVRLLYLETQHFNQLAIAESYKSKDEYVHAFLFYLSSLKCALGLTIPLNVNPIINDMKICAQMITEYKPITKQLRDSFEINDKHIRTSNLFRVIQDEYEEALELFMKKVNLNDNQK